ncbi:MAG: Xaa-Pro dipeptidase, partial [Gammaproteobacteria bacterium]|nr:Xaa-Pro dipeptidase [Gammaproteobacteria bacterium]
VRILREAAELAPLLPTGVRRGVLLGPPEQWGSAWPEAERNPPALVGYLHYHRARKSGWELACMRRAAALAAPGHHAAQATFRDGGTEFDILDAFLVGCGQCESELPYGAIVALDAHCATLHYQHRDRDTSRRGQATNLLLDAGCSVRGYASDITRSYARQDGEFARMIADLDELQQALCAAVGPGVPFPDLHRRCHHDIARLLGAWDLVRMPPDEMVAAGVTAAFFPHGLGHLLGLQVHDVGGHLADDEGRILEPPADFPRLRFLRTLEPGQVVTIEPGVYFIDSLLERLRAGVHASAIDWDAIERLRRHGGIRIEDDVLVTADGSENLTRPLL